MKTLFLCAVGSLSLLAADVKVDKLPAAVQATVREQTKNATLVGVIKEVENGKTVYEVETKASGKARDLIVDAAGKITSVEEEVDIAAIPIGARQAIQKKAAGGTITRVEVLTMGSVVAYEAAIKVKGKGSEITVNGDGSARK